MTSDRAIVRPGDVRVIQTCPCGCEGPDVCVTVSENPLREPDYSFAEKACLSDIKPQDFANVSVADLIMLDRRRKKENDVSKSVDGEIQSLIDLAVDQGWPPPTLDGTKLKWTNLEGGSISTPTRVVGRGFSNIKSQLRRLGLEIPNPQAKKPAEPEPCCTVTTPCAEHAAPAPAPVTPTDLASAVVAAQPVTPEDAFAALGWLTEFVTRHQGDEKSEEEWSQLCTDLEAERDQAVKERDAERDLLDQVRTALTTSAPWQALPTVAALLGLD